MTIPQYILAILGAVLMLPFVVYWMVVAVITYQEDK